MYHLGVLGEDGIIGREVRTVLFGRRPACGDLQRRFEQEIIPARRDRLRTPERTEYKCRKDKRI